MPSDNLQIKKKKFYSFIPNQNPANILPHQVTLGEVTACYLSVVLLKHRELSQGELIFQRHKSSPCPHGYSQFSEQELWNRLRKIYLFAWVIARNLWKIRSWIQTFMAKFGTVEKAERAFLLDAIIACCFLNWLRHISKPYSRGMLRFTSSMEPQNFSTSSCKSRRKGSQYPKPPIPTQEPQKHPRNPTPWTEHVF